MLPAPQSTRTFFVTSTTAGRRALLQSDRMAQLLLFLREPSKEAVSAACICDHAQSLPPATDLLRRKSPWKRHCNSSRAVSPIGEAGNSFAFEIWQASSVNHCIRDAEDYKHHHTYIWDKPVRAGVSERPKLFAWSTASLVLEWDAPPPGLKP